MWLVAYDISDDRRRSKVSELLESYGPRVQLSVFEAELATPAEERTLLGRLRDLIDLVEDQIRVYPIPDGPARRRLIIGDHRLQEKVPFILV